LALPSVHEVGLGPPVHLPVLPGGQEVKTVIHVNQHKIKANAKHGTRDPVLTAKTYKSNDYCHEVIIDGPCRVVYSPDKPLSCGAKVWIETESGVHCVERND